MPNRKEGVPAKANGRPPGRHYDRPFQIRFPAGQLENVREAAREDGVDVAVWIRDAVTYRLRTRSRFKKPGDDPAGV